MPQQPEEQRRTRLTAASSRFSAAAQSNQARAAAQSGSSDMERWVQSVKKAKLAEGDTPLNREVKEMVSTEALNSVRELQNHLAATDWMFADD